jgi:hypothetical protein
MIRYEMDDLWVVGRSPTRSIVRVSAAEREEDMVDDLMTKIMEAIRVTGMEYPLRVDVRGSYLLYHITATGRLVTRYVV